MSAAKKFCFNEWKNSIASTSAPTIEANDDLAIDFDASNISSNCEIFITNSGHRNITTPLVSYDDCVLQMVSQPDEELIPPLGSAHFIFTAIHFAECRSTEKQVRFMFGDGRLLTRTIRINYGNEARRNGLDITKRKNCFYDIPEVFIKATRTSCVPSQIFDAVDCLVPAYDEMNYENYGARFHGLLYLEELWQKNEYLRLQRKSVFFRKTGAFFEFDFPAMQRLPIAIGKLRNEFLLVVGSMLALVKSISCCIVTKQATKL